MTDTSTRLTKRLVPIVLASFIGVASAALFGGGAMFVASISANSLGISPMEGGQGYFVLMIGILAAPIAFIIGAGVTLYFRGFRRGSIFLGIIGSALLSLLVSSASLGVWYNFQPQALNANGLPPKLNFEISLPPNASQRFDLSQIRVDLNTDQNSMPADLTSESTAKNLISGAVELYYRTSSRILVLRLPNDEVRLFNLKLPSNPVDEKYMTWSPWHNADWIDKPGMDKPLRAEDSDFQVRYKVEPITE